MTLRIALLVVLSWSAFDAVAQDRARLMAIEIGVNMLESSQLDNERIRASSSQYYENTFYEQRSTSQMNRWYAGAKLEVRSVSNYFSLSTGVRLNWIVSSTSSEASSDYFYYLMRQSETTTEYARIREIKQVSNYVSMPLELRAFVFTERRVRLYFLAGTELGFRVATRNDVRFYDPAMEQYQEEIAKTIEKPATIFSSFYGRGGLVIGGAKPVVDIGITFPVVISRSSSTLSEPTFGGGFHLQLVRKF